MLHIVLAAAILLTSRAVFAEDFSYQRPAKPVWDALGAPPTPSISVNPSREYAIFMQPVRYPPIAEIAQPMLRLAGIRIDSATNGMRLAQTFTTFSMTR